MRDARGSRARRALARLVAVLSTAVGWPAVRLSDTTSLTGDESVKAQTGWCAYIGVTAAQVNSVVSGLAAGSRD